MKKLILGVITHLFFLFALAAHADEPNNAERITSFISDVAINQDASIDVIEQITVFANQARIRHGIVRWLPVTSSFYQPYSIKKISIDHHIAPYHTENKNGQFVIYIGNPNVVLNPGIYTYDIQYHVADAIRFLKDQDELYWNITGNHWDFPIEKVQATITAPNNVSFTDKTAYTGQQGARGQNFSMTQLAANQVLFATNNTLSPGEGLTIAVGFSKGLVSAPSFKQKMLALLLQYEVEKLIFLAVVLFIYYLIIWYCVGRDLKPGVIIPLFEPPLNLAPAAMRFINRLGFDVKAFTAAIIDMATKGFLTIQQNGQFELIKKSEDISTLSEGEKSIAKNLFAASTSFIISKDNYSSINAAKKSLKKTLISQYEKLYFITNSMYLIPGIILTLLAIITTIIASNDLTSTLYAAIFVTAFSMTCYSRSLKAYGNIKEAFIYASFTNIFSALGSLLILIPLLIITIIGIMFFSGQISFIKIFLLFILVFINIIFYHLLKAPTMQGRKIIDQIEGFKMFLSTTERDRFNQLHPPEKTPELFEKYLPYAIALNVENQWSEQFNDLLEKAGTPYQPSWYSGRTAFNVMALSVLSSEISHGLTNALTTSSQSASRGGGFSGGGGGGGGGGGW